MTTTDRTTPPLQADPITTLGAWLDFYRETLAGRCAGLTDGQLRTAAVEPSSLTLLGLLRHMAAVERNWFRVVLAGEQVVPLHEPEAGTGHSGGFVLDDTGLDEARAAWEAEVARSREVVAGSGPDTTGLLGGQDVSVVWVLTHVVAEYARHCGHADLIRERIDGDTGV